MGVWVDTLKANFEQIDKKTLFSATGKSREAAIQFLTTCETEYNKLYIEFWKIDEVNTELLEEVSKLKKSNEEQFGFIKSLSKEITDSEKKVEELEKKIERIKSTGNQERKSAVARANRYKARYDNLLDEIEAMIPGTKELLIKQAIPEEEKQKKLVKLNEAIATQKKVVSGRVMYDQQKGRQTYLDGYGKEAKILRTMFERKKSIEKNQKSY